MAELCREHNLVPKTIYNWKEKFVEGGRSSFSGKNSMSKDKRHQKETAQLKRIIGEYAVALEALKKTLGGKERLSAVSEIHDITGLNVALRLLGVSKTMCTTPRNVSPDPAVQEAVQKIAPQRPTYGTRRMAAQVSRDLNHPVNRKAVQRIFKRLGWNAPSRTKKEIIRSNRKVTKPKAPNEFWESDMSYIWCGVDGWCYCFNDIDVFTRKWLAFVLSDRATRNHAIMAVNNAVAEAHPNTKNLTLRVDNGSQYTSREFRQSISALGIALEYIYVNTPEQNGHVESFHKTLKKEYVWMHEFADIHKAQKILQESFEDYNNHRIHSALKYHQNLSRYGIKAKSHPNINIKVEVKSVNNLLPKLVLIRGVHSTHHNKILNYYLLIHSIFRQSL